MNLLFFVILVPLIGAIGAACGKSPRRWALWASLVNLLASGHILGNVHVRGGDWKYLASIPVLPALDLNLSVGVDMLGALMLALAAVVTFCAVLVAGKIERAEGLFYSCLLLISVGVIGAFVSTDLFFFYMFHELALVPTFLLIGIWGSGDRQTAAWKATIYLALGSFILLIGLIGLYFLVPAELRTFDMRKLQAMAGVIPPSAWVLATLVLGFGILISLFPFHNWAPQAYASAPAPAAMLHAGVLKKFGLYGMLRLTVPLFGDRVPWVLNVLLILLLGNILYIGLVTIAQRKLDTMLGYSSVMHMGYIFLGIVGLNAMGLTGAALLMVAHGLSIALLFALCGEIRARTGTVDFALLGGLGKQAPKLGLLFGFATMAALGLPGFANFAGEILVFFGAFGAVSLPSGGASVLHQWNLYQTVTVLSLWGVVISAIYMLRSYRRIFFGEPGSSVAGVGDISRAPRVAAILLILGLLALGFFPQPFAHNLSRILLP